MKPVSIAHAKLRNTELTGELLVTSVVYDDGRIIQQIGLDSDFKETKGPDLNVVGTCKDCNNPIYDYQEWNYSKKDNWKADLRQPVVIKIDIDYFQRRQLIDNRGDESAGAELSISRNILAAILRRIRKLFQPVPV